MASQQKYNCIITGAGGFVGQALAASLLADPAITSLTLTDIVAPPIPPHDNSKSDNIKTHSIAADLTSLATCQSIFTKDLNLVYLLHGIMSSAAEANLELGLAVNLDSTRLILDHLRTANNPDVIVIFAGSTAVYGPPPSPEYTMSERDAPNPQGSYGAQKHMCETLLDDYSRRGLLDGRTCRLPTVMVRPGKPTGAASSFASGVFREPLAGVKAILPVGQKTEMWICSPRTVVRNLMLARSIAKAKFGGSRIVNLPGRTVSVEEMLGVLESVGGQKARQLVVEERDAQIERIVETWPPRFDVGRAKALGFVEDGGLEGTVREYLEDYGGDEKH